jgi:metal-responsive CopG/Arc/MetJ family transcriptional regulator
MTIEYKYSIIESIADNDKQAIQIDISKKLLFELDKYVLSHNVSNRKRLIETLLIKFIIQNSEEIDNVK